ncbi:MAG: SDR family NAD(P)-dependent oxidoreductase [Proteobacteria bacterium]|nr:SDR family NAD(P)-dependent oxidoreductase [Pseudomonadota bacterium]
MSDRNITALVTGASAGLGAEFCRQLADRCDVIIAVARRAKPMQALAKELQGKAEVHVVEADLISIEGVARVMEVIRQKGPLGYLINNAGFSTLGDFEGELIDSQHAMVSLHINATLSLCRAAIPFMREMGGGNIVNVSSIGAFTPYPGVAVYSATKAFLNSFSESLQAELAGSGIAVQALCPGYTRTEIHDTPTMDRFDKAVIPEKYWMEVEEVVAASLLGLENGQLIVVPGEGNLKMAKKSLQKQLDAL